MEQYNRGFIEDNHVELVINLAHLFAFDEESWSLNSFQRLSGRYITDLESHFSYEETVLEAIGYGSLVLHKLKHQEVVSSLRKILFDAQSYQAACKAIRHLKVLIISHELLEDQEYWPLFYTSEENRDLINASEVPVTNTEFDIHHISLVRYVNLIHQRLLVGEDVDYVCKELRLLLEFMRFHFDEEEMRFKAPNPEHAHEHVRFLLILKEMINEISAEHVALDTVTPFLKRWILQHIENFDIGSFR